MTTDSGDNFFRLRYTNTVSFAVAVLLFLLPFTELRCNNITVASNTGLGLAFGNDYQLGKEFSALQNQFNSERKDQKAGPAKDSGKFYFLALGALLLGVAGIVLSFAKIKRSMINALIGVLAAICLVILMIQLNIDYKGKIGIKDNDISDSANVSFVFTVWYYLAIVSFLAAAFFSYKYAQLETDGRPNPRAPQLDLDNPGEQSEFPKSASESEIG